MPEEVCSLRRCLVKRRFFQLSNIVDQESGWDERLTKAFQVVLAVDFSLHALRGADPFGNTAFQNSSPRRNVTEEWNTFSGPVPFIGTGGCRSAHGHFFGRGPWYLSELCSNLKSGQPTCAT